MLHVNDLTYRIGDRLILDHASFNLPTGSKVGLVGRNGAGKSTLFKIIQGELATESGSVTLRVNPDVARVLKSRENHYLEELEGILRRAVLVKGDPQLHQEKFDFN